VLNFNFTGVNGFSASKTDQLSNTLCPAWVLNVVNQLIT